MEPGYLAIGHLTVDRLATGVAAGGTAAYAAVTASRLGIPSGVVTVAGDEIDWGSELQGVEIARVPTTSSTSFRNLYEAGHRVQSLTAIAEPVPARSVPVEWRNCPIVHLAPVAHEVSGEVAGLFQGVLIGFTPQGLLRAWDADGRVRQGQWVGDEQLLGASHVVIFSEEDVAGDEGFLDRCTSRVPVTVLTQGALGAILFTGGRANRFPAFPAREVDPTGAGDVFASAFLIEYHLSRDPHRAAAFACCAASISVERVGLRGTPTREDVEHRLAQYRGGS